MLIALHILIGILALTNAGSNTYEEEKKLHEYLFDPLRYDKSIRPVKNNLTPTKVALSQYILGLINVDITAGSMCSFSTLNLSWRDELLTWNITDYNGIAAIHLPAGKYWTPDVEKTFSATGGCANGENDQRVHSSFNATVKHDGLVFLTIYEKIGALCQVDMKYFPWDTHSCVTLFYSNKYTLEQLIIDAPQNITILKGVYKDHQEWKVQKSSFSVINTTQLIAISSVVLARRPGFVLMHSFTPAWLVSLLNLFVPLVPPDSERLSFAITTYLAMVFINLSFVAEMPKNSIVISLLSYNLMAINVIFTVGMVWNVLIVCLSKSSKERIIIPRFIKKLVGKKSKQSKPKEEIPTEISDALTQPTVQGDRSEAVNVDSNDNECVREIGWYEVTRYFDKIYLIFSFILVTAMFGVSCWLIFTRQTLSFEFKS